jgi:predicted alpha/beta-fold hydrolase
MSHWQRSIHQRAEILRGHAYTVLPYGVAALSTAPPSSGQKFLGFAHDAQRGAIPIRGVLHRAKESTRRLAILMHGITATPKDAYLRQLVGVLTNDGNDVLNLALRGAVGEGSDHYHAGLIEDLDAIFKDARLAKYDEIFLVGYSLGGQIALRFALDRNESRLRGVVGLCAPIAMTASQQALDDPAMRSYRIAILSLLKMRYHRLAWTAKRQGLSMATSLSAVRRIRTFYEWDQRVVCPRFGYSCVEDYYARVSVGPCLKVLQTPTLLVFGRQDPIVPFGALTDLLASTHSNTDVRVVSPGGHLGFSSNMDLGLCKRRGLPHQIAGWMKSH